MHSAIPLHQPSAASLNSDGSSSDLICHPSTTSLYSDDSSTGPLCHPSTMSFCHSSSQDHICTIVFMLQKINNPSNEIIIISILCIDN